MKVGPSSVPAAFTPWHWAQCSTYDSSPVFAAVESSGTTTSSTVLAGPALTPTWPPTPAIASTMIDLAAFQILRALIRFFLYRDGCYSIRLGSRWTRAAVGSGDPGRDGGFDTIENRWRPDDRSARHPNPAGAGDRGISGQLFVDRARFAPCFRSSRLTSDEPADRRAIETVQNLPPTVLGQNDFAIVGVRSEIHVRAIVCDDVGQVWY